MHHTRSLTWASIERSARLIKRPEPPATSPRSIKTRRPKTLIVEVLPSSTAEQAQRYPHISSSSLPLIKSIVTEQYMTLLTGEGEGVLTRTNIDRAIKGIYPPYRVAGSLGIPVDTIKQAFLAGTFGIVLAFAVDGWRRCRCKYNWVESCSEARGIQTVGRKSGT